MECSQSVLDVPHALMRTDIMFGSTFVATASPPSTPLLRSNRHSARCTRLPQSRDFVPWRFSDAAGRCVCGSGTGSGVRETCTAPEQGAIRPCDVLCFWCLAVAAEHASAGRPLVVRLDGDNLR